MFWTLKFFKISKLSSADRLYAFKTHLAAGISDWGWINIDKLVMADLLISKSSLENIASFNELIHYIPRRIRNECQRVLSLWQKGNLTLFQNWLSSYHTSCQGWLCMSAVPKIRWRIERIGCSQCQRIDPCPMFFRNAISFARTILQKISLFTIELGHLENIVLEMKPTIPVWVKKDYFFFYLKSTKWKKQIQEPFPFHS